MSLWYSEAIRHDGHPDKVYEGENRCLGVTMHSMEGWVATALNMVASRDGFSWPFSIDLQGTVYQHYPLDALCWHSGSERGNSDTIGIEHEGKHGVIEGPQLAASIRLVQWIARECSWTDGLDGRLFEHNQWSATLCPSGRIPLDRYVIANAPEVSPAPANESSVSERDIRTVDVGLIRLALESAGRSLRDANEALIEAHRIAGGDGDLLRGK